MSSTHCTMKMRNPWKPNRHVDGGQTKVYKWFKMTYKKPGCFRGIGDTCMLLKMTNKYWNTSVSSLTAKDPNNHVTPNIGTRMQTLRMPDLQITIVIMKISLTILVIMTKLQKCTYLVMPLCKNRMFYVLHQIGSNYTVVY